MSVENPLSTVVPEEIPLKHAPLISVLAQLRFPTQPKFDHRETVTPFFEALADAYPVVREESVRGFALQPFATDDLAKLVEPKGWTIWRLFDVHNAWRLSISRDFLALETSAYVSHGDFIRRLGEVLEAVPSTMRPPVIDRFGLRYVDRITAPALSQIRTLIRSELLGVLGTPAAQNVVQAFSESVFQLSQDRLIARWGTLPANASYDPGTIKPIPESSWILDLDMFRELTRPFKIEEITQEARAYADRIYTFFRWAIQPAFLEYFDQYEK